MGETEDIAFVREFEAPLEVVRYEGDKCPEFDEYIKKKPKVYAERRGYATTGSEGLLISEWQTPCHVILTRGKDDTFSFFHVQPDSSRYTSLTVEQEIKLREMGKENPDFIPVYGKASWYNSGDDRELSKMGFNKEKEIKVDTKNWWRVMYDPEINEIWIDKRMEKEMIKYKGF